MQLVLLSGGSGKRLWPLSNNLRSKQFLQLLRSENGSMESMVQRVVRQIQNVNLTKNITIATNKSQLDIIQNQLGDNINIVTEPERRDTFPAIALAVSFLSYVEKCSDDEVIVVMPCDPYTEADYFHTISKMVKCVEAEIADIVLMGIKPLYPSEKYGYVVPEKCLKEKTNEIEVRLVSRFTEKPTVERAKDLLAEGAYWNGGVFAFKLGFMMDIVRRYIPCNAYEDIVAGYNEFPKRSFDYEVVENVDSVAVIPFQGKWKDLGTWNSLSEELYNSVIGNAVVGTHCTNTTIVNELHTPIFVDGVDDVVVAASLDGILVCSKNYSEEIKNTVDKFNISPRYEEKRWGTSRILDDITNSDGTRLITKRVVIKPGKNTNYKLHHYRTEVLTFVEGQGILVLSGVEKSVKAGDTVFIPNDHYYSIKALTQLTFIEVQNCSPYVEDDVEISDKSLDNML